jgi:hypothetical protein
VVVAAVAKSATSAASRATLPATAPRAVATEVPPVVSVAVVEDTVAATVVPARPLATHAVVSVT